MNYALGYAFNLEEIFLNFQSRKLKIDCISLVRLYNEPHKIKLARRMFKDCCKLIIEDIIENDVEFQLPTGSRKCSIMMRLVEGDEFKIARRRGALRDIDFLETNFTGYLLMFYMYGYHRTIRTKRIYLNPKLRDRITELVNKGKAYSGMIVKTIKDYYKPIKELYPWIPNSDIQKILNFGWKSLYLHNSYGGDTLITDSTFWFYIGNLYKDSQKHMKYYSRKLALKFRVLYRRNKLPYEGFYYFSLNQEEYDDYIKLLKQRGRPRKYFKLPPKYCYKLMDECGITSWGNPYIFRITVPTDLGMMFLHINPKYTNIELILKRQPLKLKDILVTNNNYEML